MQADFEKHYHELEAIHWWFVSRRHLFLGFLTQVSKGSQVLDIGCSSGLMLQALQEKGMQATGVDISQEAVHLCQKKGFTALCMDAASLSFPDQSFDCILASDVLEHIEDDRQALSEWFRVLKPGGLLVLGVPAFSFLYSDHDVYNHHKRRYTSKQIKTLLQDQGFFLNKATYWSFILFFPIAFFRLCSKFSFIKRVSSRYQLKKAPKSLNALFKAILYLENRWLQKHTLPVGVSVIALARKP